MKKDIHPQYQAIDVKCSCGYSFVTGSVLNKPLRIEICSKCHPFATEKGKIIDTAGRIDSFRRKYGQGGRKKSPMSHVRQSSPETET